LNAEKAPERHTVIIFRPFPHAVGQKITIASGPRAGDWLIAAVGERKVTFRCPVSGREFEWDRFCYFAEERQDEPWPHRD
jgi:hypothetical protein